MEKYKEIHLQAYADGKKLNLLDFNELINIKGLDYMTQIDGEIIICRHNIEEDKKIEKIDMFDYFTGYDFDGTSKDLLKHLERNFEKTNEKLNEIIDYINKENK